MGATGDLFQLISSLSAAEKAYFKRFAYSYSGKENKDYLKLFELIARQERYNEEALRAKLKGSKLLNNFSASKRHLMDVILNTFTNSAHNASSEEHILASLAQIHFLNQHKNFDLSKKKTVQLKKVIFENELFNLYPVLYNYELEIYTYQKEDIAVRNQINKDYEFALGCMDNIRQYEHLKEVWVENAQQAQAYIRKDKQAAKLWDQLQQELLSDEKKALCGKSKTLFHYIRTGYFILLNEAESAYLEACEHFDFYAKEETYRQNNPKEYITFLANFLSRMQNANRYEKFETVKHLLLDAFETCSDEELVNAKKLNLIYAEKDLLRKKGNYDMALELMSDSLNDILKALPYFRKRKDIELSLIYDVALIYFYNHDYQKALEYINQLINDEQLYAMKDLESYAYLIRLFIILEINKSRKFDNVVENTKKKLSRAGKVYGMENVLFRLLNELLPVDSQKEKTRIIREYKPRIEKILQDPKEKNALNYFNIQWWIAQKLGKKAN